MSIFSKREIEDLELQLGTNLHPKVTKAKVVHINDQGVRSPQSCEFYCGSTIIRMGSRDIGLGYLYLATARKMGRSCCISSVIYGHRRKEKDVYQILA